MEGKQFIDQDFADFKDWIQLNLDGITWQGKYTKEFEEFWSLFFVGGLSLKNMMDRFNYSISEAKIGPLISWFNWLREKMIIYTFVYKGYSIYELAEETEISISKISSIMRNFFTEKFPHLDTYISSVFQMSNVSNKGIHLRFEQFSKDLKISDEFNGVHEDDIMPNMEITLYEEWAVFLKKMKSDFEKNSFAIKKLRRASRHKRYIKTIREFIILVLLGFLVINGITWINKWYEDYLADKISIYEPQFLRVDKNLKFKSFDGNKAEGYKIDLEKLGKSLEQKDKFIEVDEDEEFHTESEVALASWNTLPKDFDVADLEESEYEELRKGGYRDTRFGNKKVYRVMMRSTNAVASSKTLNKLIGKYEATQVDKVKPGTTVPGGFYYNLYVPRGYLKEFLAQVMEVDEAILYENRTRGINPAGKNKVFIWIKTI